MLDECRNGDAGVAAERLKALDRISILDQTASATSLAGRLVRGIPFPDRAAADAFHIAIAAVHGLDYLVTWNCTHIANGALRSRIEAVCRAAGYEPPLIVTPQELWPEGATMIEDDVLLEVRRIREEFAREHNYDIEAMGADLRALDEAEGTPTVRLEPRRPAGWVDPAFRPADASGSAPEPLTLGFVEQLRRTSVPASLSINGRGNLVVDDRESYRLLIELVDRLETVASIRRGLEDVRMGRTVTLDDFKDEVRRKYGISIDTVSGVNSSSL